MNGKLLPPSVFPRRLVLEDAAANPVPDPLDMQPEPQQRHMHRQREFGIGYGNSSGYADGVHYVDGHVDPLFRCG